MNRLTLRSKGCCSIKPSSFAVVAVDSIDFHMTGLGRLRKYSLNTRRSAKGIYEPIAVSYTHL